MQASTLNRAPSREQIVRCTLLKCECARKNSGLFARLLTFLGAADCLQPVEWLEMSQRRLRTELSQLADREIKLRERSARDVHETVEQSGEKQI